MFIVNVAMFPLCQNFICTAVTVVQLCVTQLQKWCLYRMCTLYRMGHHGNVYSCIAVRSGNISVRTMNSTLLV